jgi:hypothetical protein
MSMHVLVGGREEAAVRAVKARLDAAGIQHLPLDLADLESGEIFQQLHRDQPDVILIEELPRPGAPPPRAPLPPIDAISAACSRLLLVTGRRSEDEAMRAMRRSGVPYVRLHVPAFIDLAAGLSERLRTGRVIVPPEMLDAARGAVTVDDIASAVLDVVRDPELAGRAVPVIPAGGQDVLLRLLAGAGARPVTGRVRALAWKALGCHELTLAGGAVDVRAAASASV